MMAICGDELTCDIAETYGVFDIKTLTPTLASLLAAGLREGSRVQMKLQRQQVPFDTLLLALIADRVGLQLWGNTKDGQRNRNRPDSIVASLTQGQDKEEVKTFKSAAEFEDAFQNLAGGE